MEQKRWVDDLEAATTQFIKTLTEAQQHASEDLQQVLLRVHEPSHQMLKTMKGMQDVTEAQLSAAVALLHSEHRYLRLACSRMLLFSVLFQAQHVQQLMDTLEKLSATIAQQPMSPAAKE